MKRMLTIAAAALGLAAVPQQAAAHDEPVKGSLIGAGIGAAVGGPVGAAVGALIGAGIGSHVAHETDHPRHGHRHRHARLERHERFEASYVAPARHTHVVESGVVRCEPKTAFYKPRVVHRDDRLKASHAAPKPKTKRVCRDVPVQASHRNASWIPSG